MTQSGNGAEQAFERMRVSDPFERENGNVVRSFYHSAIGFGQVEAAPDNAANVATVTFYDLPGGVYAAVQPNYEDVLGPLSNDARDLELGSKSPAHQTTLQLAEKALGLQIVPPAVSLKDNTALHSLDKHVRDKFQKGEYGTENADRIARLETVIGRVLSASDEQLISGDWEEEGFDSDQDWQTIEDPLVEGKSIEAIALIAKDPDDGVRHLAIVSKRDDGSIRKVAFLYQLTESFSRQLLMMPMNPEDDMGAILISWNSREAEAFLAASEKLLGINNPAQ